MGMEAIRGCVGRGARARRLAAGLGLGGAALAVLLIGCREEVGTAADRNRPPDTYLTGCPAESTTSFYRVHLFWYGSDYDGRVTGYEFAITDSAPADEDTIQYRRTSRTDSIFVMKVGKTQQTLAHRFYIRAIDNQGRVDPEPAWAFFGSVDFVPPRPVFLRSEGYLEGVDSIIPITSSNATVPGDTVNAGWKVRFHWSGVDGDRMVLPNGDIDTVGCVAAFEHWLTPRQTSPIRGGLGDTVAVFTDLESGKYSFNLRAIDDAGFSGLDPTVRAFVWNRDPQTYFEAGFDSSAGVSKGRLLATSAAWAGEREYFDGDTLPLAQIAGALSLVSVKARLWGRDPDDNLGTGVRAFQFRKGVGVWELADTTDGADRPWAKLERMGTSDQLIQVRCADGYGRKDGSPAEIRFSVNRAPGLLDTLEMSGQVPVYQYPRRGQAIPVAELAAAGWRMRVRVKALDPDATTNTFGYKFRLGGFLYSEQVRPQTGQIAEYTAEIRPEWRQPGEYRVGVEIEELGYAGTHRKRELEIPFRIVN
jgi:hypothetical protein